ncbi:Protein RecA [uncultured archaeon]|nr:Protein RecA [uncultured archaeon]
MKKTETNAALREAINELTALHGKNAVRTFDQMPECVIYPTDFYEFNQASNCGGFPMGKLIEISGPPSSGKTTLAWQILAQIARITGKKILLMDNEESTSKTYLIALGVPVEQIYIPELEEHTVEMNFEFMEKLLATGAFCGCILDSVAVMTTKAELESVDEKGLEGNDMMLKAKLLTKALRVKGPDLRATGASIIFINHIMSKPQSGPYVNLGDPEETPGGNAFKHHCDMRIYLKPLDYVTKQVASDKDPKKKVNVKIGRNVRLKFIKNRVGEPFGEATMTLRNGKGFDVITSAIKRGIDSGVVVRESKGEHRLKDDPTIKASSYNNFWNLFAVNPKLLQVLLSKLNGKAVKYDPSEFDLTVESRDVTASEIGASEEDVVEVAPKTGSFSKDEITG